MLCWLLIVFEYLVVEFVVDGEDVVEEFGVDQLFEFLQIGEVQFVVYDVGFYVGFFCEMGEFECFFE